MNRIFFLDRDGVIIEDEDYLADPSKVRLCPGCAEAFRKIGDAGFRAIVLSNQSGIARGYFTFAEVKAVERRIEELLAGENAPCPDAWYYCPHHPKGIVEEYRKDCDCRKPKPGLFLQAGKDFDADFSRSYMIGDKISDLQAAFAAGCIGGALVMTGHGKEQQIVQLDRKYEIAGSILEAVDQLLEAAEQSR